MWENDLAIDGDRNWESRSILLKIQIPYPNPAFWLKNVRDGVQLLQTEGGTYVRQITNELVR